MNDFGKRLREERRRLNLSGEELAKLGGVSATSQSNYENGRSFPDSRYLAKIAHYGIDVLYILTGELQWEPIIEPTEKLLVLYFRQVPLVVQAATLSALNGAIRQIKENIR